MALLFAKEFEYYNSSLTRFLLRVECGVNGDDIIFAKMETWTRKERREIIEHAFGYQTAEPGENPLPKPSTRCKKVGTTKKNPVFHSYHNYPLLHSRETVSDYNSHLRMIEIMKKTVTASDMKMK